MMTDFGTDALMQHWKRRREQQFAAAVGSASGTSQVIGISETLRVVDVAKGELTFTGQIPTVIVSLPELLVGATLVEKGSKTDEGDIVVAVTPIFRRFIKELARDPNALYQMDPRQAEELVAGAYEEAGVERVVLTPRSGDKGRDVIVTSREFGTIRILDQVKLYSPHRVVEPADVRELYGTLSLDQGASKAIITTTSTFAPSIYTDFKALVPGRLSFRDGEALLKWLHSFDKD
jgi:restriction system protein